MQKLRKIKFQSSDVTTNEEWSMNSNMYFTNVGKWKNKSKLKPNMKLPVCSVAMTVGCNKNTQLHYGEKCYV